MNQVIKLQLLKNLSYFTKDTLAQLMEVSEKSIYANIERWVKNKKLILLKRGLYVTREYYDKNTRKDDYLMFIANKLREPSYVSLEFVLQKYGILTESVFAFTSITLKSKRMYKNKLGFFIYKNIAKKLFTGFTIKTYGGYEIKEATKMKALFDYLYLKLQRIQKIDKELLQSYRFNLNKFTKNEEKEFSSYGKKTNVKKYVELLTQLREAYDI